MESKAQPGHTHSCVLVGEQHINGDHYCTECQRWFRNGSGET